MTRGAGALHSAHIHALVVLAVMGASATSATSVAAQAAAPREGGRIVVAGPDGDALTERVRAEMGALGFATLRASAPDGCDPNMLRRHVENTRAVGATCTTASTVEIWVAGPSGIVLREAVSREAGPEGDAVVSLRAAEIARASVAHAEESPSKTADAAPTSPTGGAPAPSEADAAAPSPSPAPSEAGTATPARDAGAADKASLDRLVLGLGSGVLAGGAAVPVVSGNVAARIARRLAFTARFDYPLAGDDAGARSHPFPVTVSPAFAAIGLETALDTPGKRIVPRLGVGLSALWLRATTEATLATGEAYRGDDSTVGAGTYVTLGVAIGIAGPLRLGIDALGAFSVQRLKVVAFQEEVASWGLLYGGATGRLELAWR